MSTANGFWVDYKKRVKYLNRECRNCQYLLVWHFPVFKIICHLKIWACTWVESNHWTCTNLCVVKCVTASKLEFGMLARQDCISRFLCQQHLTWTFHINLSSCFLHYWFMGDMFKQTIQRCHQPSRLKKHSTFSK